MDTIAGSNVRTSITRTDLLPGARVRVKQKVTVGSRAWVLEVSGVVRDVRVIETGIHTDRVRSEDFCVESVLLEKPGRHDGQMVGRSPYLQSVHVAAAKERIGEIVPALISGASANSLSGSLAEAVAA